jgi:hypothetical protein
MLNITDVIIYRIMVWENSMAKPREVITESFLKKIKTEGDLAKASRRLLGDLDKYERLPKMPTWTLICEEITDTQHEPLYYERIVAELKRRGIDNKELKKMRLFAWETAGWLNYEKMLWEWVSLGSNDIRKALDCQVNEGEITDEHRREALEYLAKYE